MKKIVLGMLLIGLSAGVGITAMTKPSGTAVINWVKGGKGATIDYSKHKAAGIKCNDCHRQHKDGKRHMKGCATCHNTKANAMKTGHKLCLDCHKAKGKGATACKDCHK